MPAERILILAGTAEARDLANALVALGCDVTSSFAGVTQEPLLPVGHVHKGGFGGSEGFRVFLRDGGFNIVVDATHPFAAQMSAHAHAACAAENVRLLRLERPAWQPVEGDRWILARDMDDAVRLVPKSARVLVTTGRKGLSGLLARADLSGLIRTIEPPDVVLPAGWSVILDRPPHQFDSERGLMIREHITWLLSKNAGGRSTEAKLAAARALGVPVVMVERPRKPACETVSTVAEALLGITGKAV
jgi:precorrin-6A/cobalt-precorrin-6A reductase